MKKSIKIFILFLIIWISWIVISNAKIVSNDPTVNSGGTVSITLTSSEKVQAFKASVSSSGGLNFGSATINSSFTGTPNGSNVSGISTAGGTTLVTYTFTAPSVEKDTTYTVQFSGSTSVDGSGWNSFSNKSTVTVKAPSTPSNNDNSNNNNANNNNNNNKEEEDLPTASDGATATTVKSSNNYLKSLNLSTGSINFNKKTTQYTIDVEEEIDSITISAVAEHEKATVTGTGKIALEKGTNTINVVVTAENGTARNYVLTVNRAGEETEEEEEQEIIGALTSLVLKGVKDNGEIVEILLDPEFATDVFYYECEIPEGINFIDVETEYDILDAIVEITGNENLVDGENLINVIIKYTDENEEEQVITYQISANKKAAIIEQEVVVEEEKGLSPIQIGVIAGSVSIALIIIIVLIVKYRKQQNEEDEFDFGGYGQPFYSEEEENSTDKEIENQADEKDKDQEQDEKETDEADIVSEVTEEDVAEEEELESWNDYEPTPKRKIFGKNAKKGKHF